MEMTGIILVLLGIVVLFAGRKLYWLFVGVVGFFIGISLAHLFFSSETEIVMLVIALAAGIICASLALFLHQFAVGLAGFAVGGYLLATFLDTLHLNFGIADWIVYLAGGIIGAAMIVALFDWSLIVLSSLTGAGLMVDGFSRIFSLNEWVNIFAFVFLCVIGIGVQFASMRNNRIEETKENG
jgi:hypothetical protein